MTKTQIFKKVEKHLLKQKRKAEVKHKNGVTSCLYRYIDQETNEVLKCAVGCLIPDNKYDENLEGCSASDIKVVHLLSRIGVLGKGITDEKDISKKDREKIRLLRRLQMIHDSYLPHNWEGALEEVRRDYDI